jgi:hypothetical protein
MMNHLKYQICVKEKVPIPSFVGSSDRGTSGNTDMIERTFKEISWKEKVVEPFAIDDAWAFCYE